MKKFKYLPTIIIMVLCIAIIGVGIYAINLTQNKVVGSLTIGASNPAVNLTVYYVPDGTTAENAVLNDANKIGTTKTARYGVELDLTDDRLNFKMSNINSLSEVKPKNIAIKIENTSDKVLGAYFADLENAAEVKTTLALSSYNSRVAFTEGTLVPGHAKADFSGYKKIPAKANDVNGEAIVKMSVSILKLSGIRLYIDIDALLVIEEYDPAKGGVDFETDPHIAMNITEEAYQFNTSALSTTGTTIDAEVYNFSGMNVGLVNLKYEDSQVAALSSTSKRTPSALSVSPLTNVTTFSFNYSVTTADGTKVSAEEIFSDENTTDGIVFIGIGNYAGVSNIFPDMMSGTLVQFTKGNEFTVLGDVITITYDLSEELLFFIGHETAEGMKITISTVDSSTKLSLVTAIDKRVESLIPLEVGALISIPTDSNVILDDQSLGVMPVRAYRTTTANPSFAFAIMIGEEIAGVETLVSAGFMAMMIKGCYTDPLECLINLETGAIPQSDMLNKGTDYDFSGAEVIINQELLTQEYQDFTLIYTTIPGFPLYTAGINGTNVFAMLSKAPVPVYEDYVKMEGNDSFTYTFVDEPTEIAKDTNGELDGMYVSISKMAIKNFPQTDSLNAAVISTDAVYESIFIIDKSLFDMAISYGMTLVDLYSVLGSDAAEMGMYVSAGTPTETGTEFEILETFLAGGSKDFVLIMILPPNMLSEQSTKTINFEFSLATITDPLIYSLSTDSNTNEQYYSVTGSYIDVQEIKVPATHKDIPVKAIASSAFKNSAVTTLNLSEATNLTTIDSSAFYGCASLTSADLSKATNLTTINNSAFYNCTNLTSITIPESVTSIGSSAFYNCTGLTEINYNAIKVTSTNSNIFANAGTAVSGITVNVGANVTLILDSLFYGVSKVQTVNFANGSVCATIGKQAFMSCSNLTSINLPSSLTTIGNQAFYSTGLTAITIPEKVSSIGERAFGYCSALADMVVDSNNTTYTSANGAKAIIQSTNNTLIAGCKNTEIPSTVQAIGNYAFVGCTGLNSVTIPEGLTTVGNYAFSGCSALTSVNFNGTSSLTTIGNYAFENCSALPSIDLSGKNSLTTIGTYAFKNCNKFTNITIPASVTSIGSYAFNSCTKLTSVNISSLQDWLEISFGGLAFATKYSLFVNNQALTQITMPAGITKVNSYAFHYCSGITSVSIPETVTGIGTYAFYNCSGLTSITIPEAVTSIESYALYGCTTITSITIPAKVTSIASYAFGNLTGLTEINYNATTLSTSLNTRSDIFYNAGYNAGGITVNIGANVTSIPAYLFYVYSTSYAPKLKTLIFKDGSVCTSIGTSAFYYCTNLKSITIPESVKSIGSNAFYNCTTLTEINFNATNITTSPASNSYLFYRAGQSGSGITVNIGANVTLIPAYLFYGSSSSYAPKIIALNFASGSVCSTIGTYAFYYCSSLPEVTIPSSITTIGSYAFYYCSGLKTVNNQSSLDIVAGATTHGYVAYYATSVLTGVTEGNVVYRITDTEKIALRAVSQTETTITLAEDCTGIAENAFKDLTTLTTITIPASVTSIGASAFSGCTGLTSITIPANVTSIGNYAFRDLTALTEINYNAKELTTALVWGSDIFYNAGTAGSGITVNIGASVTSIPDYLFFVSSSDYRPYVTTLNIGENVTSIGTYAFAYLRGLTSITIPEKVSSIGSDAFGGCTALTEINYNAKELTTALTSDSRIFTNAGRLSSGITVNIGSSVTSIPDYLFHAGHTSFTPNVATLIISENVTSIGTSAFSGLRALTSITISSSETSIASSAFYECYALAEVYDLSSLDIVAGNSDNGYVAYYAKVVHTTLDAPTRLLEENGVKYYVYDGEKIALCSTYRNATAITLAEDCTKINQYAFYNCEALTSITIPESVTSIGDYAFRSCGALTTVDLTNATSLTSIGVHAFLYCTALTSITIPASVTSIGGSAFRECNSLRITVAEDNADYSSDAQGALYNKNKTTLIMGLDVETFIVPDTVTSIGSYAFSAYLSLTNIIIPASVTSIGYEAFYNCTALTSITIPSSVTSIATYAFLYCNNLKTIVVEAHTDATEVTSCEATLPTISGYTWYVYEGDSIEGTQVTTNYIQYSNVKYTYKAVANS